MYQKQSQKDNIELQFEELIIKAKAIYPNIDDAIVTLNNMTAQTLNIQDYLNLATQTPSETSNNQISIS